jgi:hypothetical protein
VIAWDEAAGTMVSDRTRHSARRTEAGWVVTWLPDAAVVTEVEARSAMVLAELAEAIVHSDDPGWGEVDRLAGELGLTGPAALMWVGVRPEWEPRSWERCECGRQAVRVFRTLFGPVLWCGRSDRPEAEVAEQARASWSVHRPEELVR